MSHEKLENFIERCECALEFLEWGERQDAMIILSDLYTEMVECVEDDN